MLLEVEKEKIDNILLEVCGKQDLLWLLLPTVGRSGGILVMWDSRVMKVIDNLIGEFSVSIEVLKEDDIKWWFTAIYGPCNPRQRESFWDELAGLRVICGGKWCLGGDFNVVRTLSKKLNSQSTTTSMRCFDSLINELELIDPPILNAKYTWSNFRDIPICCRLDRFLFTEGWMTLF